jgi:hypothetical protein
MMSDPAVPPLREKDVHQEELVPGEFYILRVAGFNKGDNLLFELKDTDNQPAGYQSASHSPLIPGGRPRRATAWSNQ